MAPISLHVGGLRRTIGKLPIRATTLLQTSSQLEGLQAKLWALKVVGVLALRISGFSLENPRTKCHLDVGPVASHRVYYKGDGGGFPQVRAMVSFVSPRWLVVHLNTKSTPTMH
jgi:hypothetical protein